jgi:membrane-associated phospholipid phosphatase
MLIADALSISTGALYTVPLGLAIYQQSLEPLLGLAGLLGTLGIGEGLKHYVIGDASVRPRGARDCNAWATNGPCEGQPGMPSTHTAFATFFAVFYGTQLQWFGQMLLVFYVMLVAASRLAKRCHTLLQVVAGGCLGIVMAFIFLRLSERVQRST